MPIFTKDLMSHVEHALGGTPASQITGFALSIINQAGRHFFAHPWKFRERIASPDLQTTASQSYVNLPDDLGEILYLHMTDGLTDSIKLTTLAEVIAQRNSTVNGGSHYLAAVSYPETYSSTTFVPVRLELSPTPSAVESITLAYRASWKELLSETDATEYVDIPVFAEAALISLVRAFALGYEEGDMTRLIMEAEASPVFQQALATDGLMQPDYGPLAGGSVQGGFESGRLPFNTIGEPFDGAPYNG